MAKTISLTICIISMKLIKMKNKIISGYMAWSLIFSLFIFYANATPIPTQNPNDGVFKIKLKNNNDTCVYANLSEVLKQVPMPAGVL